MTFAHPQIGQATSPAWHITALILVALMASTVVGSYFAKTEIIAQGIGKIIPSQRVQNIRALYRGKIKEIYVRDGDRVVKGQKLISIDSTQIEIDLKKSLDQSRKQNRELLRMNVEETISSDFINGTSKKLEEYFGKLNSAIITDKEEFLAEKGLIESKYNILMGLKKKLNLDIEKLQLSEKIYNVELNQLNSTQTLLKEKLKSKEKLKALGTISNTNLIDEKLIYISQQGRIDLTEARTLEIGTLKDSLYTDYQNHLLNFQADIIAQKNSKTENMRISNSTIDKLQYEYGNSVLLASVAGIVENLSVHTIGGFVNDGEALLTLTPTNDDYEFEALIANNSIGFVEKNQEAIVRFDAFPSERYGHLKATVIEISSDAVKEINGQWFYSINLELKQNHLTSGSNRLLLLPGMTAKVDIVTGERRIISYFFEPILKAMESSFSER